MQDKDKGLSYKAAGVDIDAGAIAKKRIGELVRATFTPNVLTEVGGFGGLFAVPQGMRQPVLVASADGVGTKIKVAIMAGVHTTVGQDLVNHCVNDILCTGARPLFFLDYIATGRLEPGVVTGLVEGLATACAENGCALIGGETAEMPDFYAPGEYDLAGTIIGILERDAVLDGSKVVPGDRLYGLPSSGLQTNGYSLARKVFFDHLGLKIDSYVEDLGCSVGEELLKVHRSFGPVLHDAVAADMIKGLAHITGGGITDNLPRSLGKSCKALIRRNSWPVLPVFAFMQRAGTIDEMEMLRVFNMGIGMIAVVGAEDAAAFETYLTERNEPFHLIGETAAGEPGVAYV